ncbi:MAG: family 20 glycosylhydrolase [Acidobacteriota bacterium]
MKTRRDFLVSCIAGLAGSNLLAERLSNRAPATDTMLSAGMKHVTSPPEGSAQGNPAGGTQAGGRMYGFALRFKSHPELITHKNALTHQQARELALYAQERSVDLIPEIESFGHTRFITGVPSHAHLGDRMPGGHGNFSAVSPVAPETLKLISDLYREVAEIFPSPYLHGGCDEVNWGGSALSRETLKTRSRDEIWAEYLNSLDRVAQGLGKEFIVWGDYVLHKRPGVLPRLNKDIIVMDWQYYVTNPKPLEQAARKVIDTGLRVIGAPALISCRWGPRAGVNALRNIDAYADAYKSINSPKALGVIVTNWMPSRYIQRSLWDSHAYASIALRQGSSTARSTAFRQFVEKFYQAEWNENWSDIFTTLYEITPNKRSCSPPWMRPVLPVPWRNEAELKAAVQSGMLNAPPFRRLLSQLVFSEAQVRDNFDDFLTFRLSIEYLEHIFWRNTVLVQEAAKSQRSPAATTALIRTIAERDQRLLEKVDASWDKGRARDAAARTEQVFDLRPGDQLLYTFHQAAAFSQQLARDPDRFSRLLSAAR